MVFTMFVALLQLRVVLSSLDPVDDIAEDKRFKRCDAGATDDCGDQRNTAFATCTKGGCDQTGALYCSCDGGGCVQTDSYGCTCDVKGGCTQLNATRSSCTGGTCTIDGSAEKAQCCEGGECKDANGTHVAPSVRNLCIDRGAKWKKNASGESYACEELRSGDECADADCVYAEDACYAKPQLPSNTKLDGCIDHVGNVNGDTSPWSNKYNFADDHLLPVFCSARCHLSKIFAVNLKLKVCVCGRLRNADSVAISELSSKSSSCVVSQYAIYKRAATSVLFALDSSGSMMQPASGRTYQEKKVTTSDMTSLSDACQDLRNKAFGSSDRNRDMVQCFYHSLTEKESAVVLFDHVLVDLGWEAYTCLLNSLPQEIKAHKRVGVHWIAHKNSSTPTACIKAVSGPIAIGSNVCDNMWYKLDDASSAPVNGLQQEHWQNATFSFGTNTSLYDHQDVKRLWYHHAATHPLTYMWEHLSQVISSLYVQEKINTNYGHLEVTVITDGQDHSSTSYFANNDGLRALNAKLRGEHGVAPRFRVLCMGARVGVCAAGADVGATGGSVQHFEGSSFVERRNSVLKFCNTTTREYHRCNTTQLAYGTRCINLPECTHDNECIVHKSNDVIKTWLHKHELGDDFPTMKCSEKFHFTRNTTVKVCENSDLLASRACTDSKKSECACGESRAWCAADLLCVNEECLPTCATMGQHVETALRMDENSAIRVECACGGQKNYIKCGLTQQCVSSGDCVDDCNEGMSNCMCDGNRCSVNDVCVSSPGEPKKMCMPECNATKVDNCVCGTKKTLCYSASQCVNATVDGKTDGECRPGCLDSDPTSGCVCGKQESKKKCPVGELCNDDGVCVGEDIGAGKEDAKTEEKEKESGDKNGEQKKQVPKKVNEIESGKEKEGKDEAVPKKVNKIDSGKEKEGKDEAQKDEKNIVEWGDVVDKTVETAESELAVPVWAIVGVSVLFLLLMLLCFCAVVCSRKNNPGPSTKPCDKKHIPHE